MAASFLLALREGVEAALVISITLGVLHKMNLKNLAPAVWAGLFSAAVLSLLTAVVLTLLGTEFEGLGEQLFEGIAMTFAAGLLTWMILWMKRHAGSMKDDLEGSIRSAVQQPGKKALFFVAFLAVLREGIELSLFLLAARLVANPFETITGALLGLVVSALLGWGLFISSHRVNLKKFFAYTNLLLVLFAAGLVGMAVHEFNETGLIPAIIDHVWDLSFVLPADSTLGIFLRALFGYDPNPSLTSVLAYALFLISLLFMLFRPRTRSSPRPN